MLFSLPPSPSGADTNYASAISALRPTADMDRRLIASCRAERL